MLRPFIATVFLAAAAGLCSCGRAPVDHGTPLQRAETRAVASDKTPLRPAVPTAEVAPALSRNEAPPDADWPPVEMRDPDPRMRHFALEQWARNPTPSLDVVAAALVDPEESIRERAEQIFEDALARRR